jgi:hypothetical protein
MTDLLTLDPVDIPGTPEVEPDPAPPIEDEYPCQLCGRSLTYGGRGRKPKKCSPNNGGDASCYGGAAKTAPRTRVGKSNNESLARQAADTLLIGHGVVAFGAMGLGLDKTAEAIGTANTNFDARAYSALLANPKLCRMIVRGGSGSGAIMFFMAYAMFAMEVAPIAVEELRAKKAAKEESA